MARFVAGGVFWLDFADPMAIPDQVEACGGPGGLDLGPLFRARPPESRVREVLAEWRKPLPTLLIFDGCPDEERLDLWCPPTGGARVLATSRRTDWDPGLGAAVVPVEALDACDGVALLRGYRPDLPAHDHDLIAIATALGGHPGDLNHAGAWLQRHRYDLPSSLCLDLLGRRC